MAFVKRMLGNWWVVTIAAALLAMLVLCVGLPLVVPALRPGWVRLLLLLLVAAGWGLALFFRRRRARKAANAIAEAMARDDEGSVVGERLRDALAKLKAAGGGRRDYLYAKPWYVIVGPPGAGKTTAFQASGLRFPLVDQAMKGAGGTRNVDFWFADEAVLVDTAGRYTTQDSDEAADAAGWRGFLQNLRRHRPLRPINGVLVAVGLDEIASADRATLDGHALAIRRRLAELADTLEVEVPAYLLLTKADLLAGFEEYYDDLDAEGRRAVLGRTFEASGGAPDADRVADAFDEVARAVSARQAMRLADEPDLTRRSLILGYPTQLEAVRARLVRFIEGAFVEARPGAAAPGALRGFYLTSGTQRGAPIDRLIDGLTDSFQRPREPAASGSGRAYFLNRLLGEVVFPEAGLARLRRGAQRRRQAQASGALAAVAGVALLVVALWTMSFFTNRAQAKRLADAAAATERSLAERGIDMVEVNANDAGLEEAAAALDQLRALPGGYAARRAGYPPLSQRFGLWQRGLSDEAEQAYLQGLRRILLPRLLLRTETVLAASSGDPFAAYEPLKAYLMLGGQRPGGIDPRALGSWVRADWQEGALAGPDRADLRKRLAGHLDALLKAGELDRVWADRRAPLDAGLVAQGRATVQAMSMGDRAYAILRARAAAAGPDWAAARVLSSADAVAFANGGEVLGLTVPFFLTRDGYARAYRPALAAIPEQVRQDAWVLGGDAASGSVLAQLGAVRPAVAARYAQDYVAAWEQVVATLRPAALFSDPAALGTFAKTPSPLALLLREVRRNTSFDGKDAASLATTAAANRIGSALGGAAPLAQAATGGSEADAGTMIAQRFATLNAYVGDGKTPSPLDQLIEAIRTGGQAVLAARAAGAGGGAGLMDAISNANAAIQLQAGQAPPALQAVVADVAGGGASAQQGIVQGNLREAYANSLLPACRAVTSERYPFFAGTSADASVSETVGLFGPGGQFSGFVEQRLQPLLDTAGPVWRWRGDDPAAAAFDPGSADALAKTMQIRQLLVAGQPFKVQLVEAGPGIDAVELSAGGQTQRFEAAARDPRQYQWTLQGGLPEAHLTLFKGGQKVDEVAAAGPWAVFRLFDKARRRNDGPTAFLAAYGAGDRAATLRIILPDDRNPFSRGGLWTFRCPVTL